MGVNLDELAERLKKMKGSSLKPGGTKLLLEKMHFDGCTSNSTKDVKIEPKRWCCHGKKGACSEKTNL